MTAQNARYGTDESKLTYQITDTEDAARGFIKKNRFVRQLSATEQTQLAALCQLSSFDLPEPAVAASGPSAPGMDQTRPPKLR